MKGYPHGHKILEFKDSQDFDIESIQCNKTFLIEYGDYLCTIDIIDLNYYQCLLFAVYVVYEDQNMYFV